MRSLVLLGHGSHTDGAAASSVYKIADAIRERGLYEEVVEGFWKEEPLLRVVLKTVMSTDVVIIPLMISEGYITENVFPREMGLNHHGVIPDEGVRRVNGGRQIRYTQPYGLHPMMSELVLKRALETLSQTQASAQTQDWVLILLAQQQPRYKSSPHPAQKHAQRLRERGIFADVKVAFASDKSGIRWPNLETLPTTRRIVVPFWGSDLSPQNYDVIPNNELLWAQAAGTHESLIDVIVQLAQQHALPSNMVGDFHPAASEAWEALLAWLDDEPEQPSRIGEVLIRQTCDVYELRHMLDEGRHSSDLVTLVTADGLRDLLRYDNAGRYRPVRGWRDLPTGWRAVLAAHDFRRGLHYLYPGAVEESYLHKQHNLHATPWASTARRQTGAYGKVQKASEKQLEQLVSRVCSGCLKTPLWYEKPLRQTFFERVPAALPCAEACTFVVGQLSGELERRVIKFKKP